VYVWCVASDSRMLTFERIHSGEHVSTSEDVGESGSFMLNVYRTILSVRALFNGLENSVLPGWIDGETMC